MYSRTKRKNMTRFDYFVRVFFALLLIAFTLTVLLLEPYREDLIAANNQLEQTVDELNRVNDQIDAANIENTIKLFNE